LFCSHVDVAHYIYFPQSTTNLRSWDPGEPSKINTFSAIGETDILPSRGYNYRKIATTKMATSTPTAHLATQDHHTAQSRLSKASDSIKYLYDPTHGPQPTRLRTRSLLRSARYIAIFIFWRLFRYAKYAAIGALGAAVAGTAVGSVVSGAAFVVAPTGIVGGAGAGLLWAIGKFGWRRARARMERSGDPRKDEKADADGEEEVKPIRVPRTEPW
jgi:hypothetical protein